MVANLPPLCIFDQIHTLREDRHGELDDDMDVFEVETVVFVEDIDGFAVAVWDTQVSYLGAKKGYKFIQKGIGFRKYRLVGIKTMRTYDP